ncbi:type VI secretion system membrane subunit TssM [Ectothiorhodospira variabilis]|uniref:type VI secretion system membrane subunit TssM n=1 Tax=Ectothiorhodospira variabilis TaxID=505694 RepID=UPI001EFB09D4|nr:type VI secretion system membrane subunit TssM [Ectothiorhodospira variabilis]MCG5496336.1 type VI secretion system membrane subunit TssM [Ectothiorhodospira variabilis]
MTHLLARLRSPLMRLAGPAAGLVVALGLVVLFWSDIRAGLDRVPLWLLWAFLLILCAGLLVWWRARIQRDRTPINDPANGSRDAVDEECRDLNEAHKAIHARLESTPSARIGLRRRQAAAPWYLLMGPSNSGKTRLLNGYTQVAGQGSQETAARAAVEFRLLKGAVWVELRGKVIEQADRQDLWRHLLDRLRQHRSRQPLKGLILTLSLPALLEIDPPQRDALVGMLRRHLQELCETLGQLPPVHLMLTHMDQIPGFTWLAPVLADEDDRVWSFALNPQRDTLPQLDEALGDLLEDLDRKRLRALDLGRDPVRGSEIIAFPHRMERAAGCLRDALTRLCRPEPGQEMPPILTLYLTGTTGAENRTAEDTASLTLERIQGDPATAQPTQRQAFRTMALQGTLLILTAALLVSSLTLLHPAKRTQADLMGASASLLQALSDNVQDREPEILASLAAIHAHGQRLESPHGHAPLPLHPLPWWPRNQAVALDDSVARVMNAMVLPDALNLLEARIQERARQWISLEPAQRELERPLHYEDLRLYLMIHLPDRRDEHILLEGLTTLMSSSLPSHGPVHQPDASTLDALWRRWFTHGLTPDSPMQSGLVAKVRSQLQTEASPQAAYARLQSRAARDMGSVVLEEILGRDGARLIRAEHTLPRLYTAKAWQQFALPTIDELVQQALQGDWVTQDDTDTHAGQPMDPEQVEALTHDLRQRYLDDYQEAWRDFLAGLSVMPFRDLSAAAEGLGRLGAETGPLTRLASWTHDNLTLSESPIPLHEALGTISRGVDTSSFQHPVLAGGQDNPGPLLALLSPEEDALVSTALSDHLDTLRAIASHLESLMASADPGREARVAAAGLLQGRGGHIPLQAAWMSTSSLLADLPVAERPMLEPLLRSAVREPWRTLVYTAVGDLERQWQGQVMGPWRDGLAGRFPFDPQGRDAALVDVVDFFHPEQGLLWGFVHEHLSPFLQDTRGTWRPRTWIGVGPTFSRGFVRNMAQADEITRSLFAHGQGTAQLSFHLYPMPSPGLSEVVFESNGQVYRYRNEPQEWRRFAWPGDAGTPGARVRAVDHHGLATGEYRQEGIWGLFRLLHEAHVEADDGEGHVYTTRWQLPHQGQGDPQEIRFRIRPDRQQNFLRQQLFTGFELTRSPFLGSRG